MSWAIGSGHLSNLCGSFFRIRGRSLTILLFLGFSSLLAPSSVEAYVGPGAGFAFVSSFFILLVSFFLALLTLLTWPFRWLLSRLRLRRVLKRARVKRVVVVGLDGQDPDLTERFMEDGLLPNFSRLKSLGSYHRLATTLPAESPVAWSSFQTGCNPGRHRVFDFFVPNRQTYFPELASAQIKPPRRALKMGRYRIPLSRPRVLLKRRSQSFWKILGEHGVFSTILRVPITFPPEPFNGLLLSAMSVPDLNGTQGTFSYYTSEPQEELGFTGGVQIPIEVGDGRSRAFVEGPPSPLRVDGERMCIPFAIRLKEGNSAELEIADQVYKLAVGEYTPWIRLKFRAGLGIRVRGLVRFYLKACRPNLKLYMSPVNLDPQKPALPISHPFTYGVYLAKNLGDFSTLGIAEDTWALNERILDEAAFLKQTYLIHEERKRMFFDALEKTRRGALVTVFDITDRIQHMFWRYQEENHPANLDRESSDHQTAITDLYREMDALVGQVMEQLDSDTLLLVMSDHGFKSFQWGVNLNRWLLENGYLCYREDAGRGEWFRGVDWSQTRAFAMGLGGIYLNVEGREAQGVVEPGQVERVKKSIICGLEKLVDEARGLQPVRRVYDTLEVYSGPYIKEAPDLIVGFRPGYRVSWGSALGVTDEPVISENRRSWSGDHCVNPSDVPGVLFSSFPLENKNPRIIDIGPTILEAFGVPVPSYVDGRPLH